MITLLSIASVLTTVLNVTIIFGAGYVTAYYVQYKKEHKSLNEKSKEA